MRKMNKEKVDKERHRVEQEKMRFDLLILVASLLYLHIQVLVTSNIEILN